jgi:hypothetical protein
MAKTRTTLTLDEATLKAVKIRAARAGQGESEFMEEAIKKALGLDFLKHQWANAENMTDDEVMEMVLDVQKEVRREMREERREGSS